MRLSHISLVARNADRLASFYIDAFGCRKLAGPRRLSGAAVSRGNGLPGSEITSIWLGLPEQDAPFLEFLEYTPSSNRAWPRVDEPGYGHMSFDVADIRVAMANVLEAGGSSQGQLTNFGTEDRPFFIVYVRDPEGNVLELEQASV